MQIRPKVLQKWDVGEMQVHGIRDRMLVKKWLRLYQTKRNLASGDMGIPLVVIRLGVQALVSPRPV